jgi:hypothetical protein
MKSRNNKEKLFGRKKESNKLAGHEAVSRLYRVTAGCVIYGSN